MTRADAIARLKTYAGKHGQQALATKLRCTRSFVSLLLSDKRSPGLPTARILNRDFQIPFAVWDEAA